MGRDERGSCYVCGAPVVKRIESVEIQRADGDDNVEEMIISWKYDAGVLEENRRERDSLKVQLDSCQGALREVIAENTANCDRADMAERLVAAIDQDRAKIIAGLRDSKDHLSEGFIDALQRAETAETELAKAQEEIRRLKELT